MLADDLDQAAFHELLEQFRALHAAHRFQVGPRDRLPVGDDGERFERRRGESQMRLPVMQAIAIIALVESASGFLTATGLSAPIDEAMNYPVGNGIHDLWVVPTGPLGEWSDSLAMDAEISADQLPLGEQGGVVGLVRDATGAPIAGAVVAPVAGDSSAMVRYVNADNTVSTDMTTDTGIFIVIGANQFGEDFEATLDGAPLASGTAGATDNAVFTLILNAE